MRKILVFVILLASCSLALDKVLASPEIPGNLTPPQTPQFVSIGFDDNYYAEGMVWILNYLKKIENPTGKNNHKTFDGTPVRVSFFNNTNNAEQVIPGTALANTYVEAYKDGHEIGNHTKTHTTSEYTFGIVWKKEIAECKNELASLDIPPEKIIGFRAPFLRYNDATFNTLKELGFLYDCSIESGFDDQTDGTNFTWPYELDKGAPENKSIKEHPGLWEMPAYAVIAPPELRQQIKKNVPDFDDKTGKITGFDWNLVAGYSEGGVGLTKAEYLSTLKYTLDQRLKGNRAPMLFGAHTSFYTAKAMGVAIHPPNISYQEMREVIQEFIAYALTKPEVRIVPYCNILEWCKNPEALTR
jgi:peptidoglycan/xylan/chitin deacetylase (PgdA/CDA1 family)